MSLSYKTLFTLCLSTTCPSLQVWGDPAKPSLRQEQHCLRRLWHEHCQCCVRQNTCFLQLHCKRTTQAQHNGCTISSLLSPRTKSWGSWAVSILHLSATCHLSCLTRAEQPYLRNKLWGQLRKAPGSCCRVCCSSGTLLVCLLWEGTEAQKALTEAAVCWCWMPAPAHVIQV